VNDGASLAAKIRVLAGDSAMVLRMKIASREKAQEFDCEKIVGEYEKLLRAAAQRAR
jgi:glycosyltransferase involved in cell wall biosynthesis